jgi:preprotein translocase subunit SecA
MFSKVFGDESSRELKKLQPIVDKINKLEPEFEKLSDDELKGKTLQFRKEISNNKSLDDILPEAFAAVRESAKRTLGQRHFDVQLLGGMVMHNGNISEMKTGEGKTLVATLPVYLNALSGNGAHVVTVNDYLSRRDAVWMGQIYNFLGMSVGVINHDSSFLYDSTAVVEQAEQSDLSLQADKERDTFGSFKIVHEFLRPCLRKEAYSADITYGTNNEFGFDYLRDNMAYSEEQMSQREHNFAIVDEVDSILIDEARTPLIISAPDEESGDLYKTFARIVPRLQKEEDYTVDEKFKAVEINDSGIEKVEKALGIGDIYTEKGIKYVHHLEQALRAQALFEKDKDYVVKGGEIIIVDEFTGRMMPGRRWSEGLHQAVEAKEGVAVQKESRTLASITFQNYFRLYSKLSGMTGTAVTSKEEFQEVYNLDVLEIPTNKPLLRKDLPDKIFQTEEGKWKALAQEVKERSEAGQPVLVGTVSIEKNEKLSLLLQREGIEHKLLNAKHHEEEGMITAQAGRAGAVTIATNMAGRGVDIVLGGNPKDPERSQKVMEAGGLAVIGTERHEARRIDNQLRGRAGRQGDTGSTQFYVSLEDDLMRVFGPDKIKRLMGTFGIPEDEAIENKMVSRALESAQEKIEGFHFDARKHVLQYDNVMNKQRTSIYNRRGDILFSNDEEIKSTAAELLGERIVEIEGKPVEHLRFAMLRSMDLLWMEHLEAMDYMRSSVRLRAYGNRDPLIEYKNEGARMFDTLLENMDKFMGDMMLRVTAAGPQAQINNQQIVANQGNKPDSNVKNRAFNKSGGQVGRNDPCSCGSGKKYKKCHMTQR